MTEMMVRLAGLACPRPVQPFTAFPLVPGVYHSETLSEIAEEDEMGSWEGVPNAGNESENQVPKQYYTVNFRAPVSPGSSMDGSQISEVTQGNYVTDDDIKILGPPPKCQHGMPCRVFISRKEGPNHSRLFWRCQQPRNLQCQFFAWTLYQPYWSEMQYQPMTRNAESSTGTRPLVSKASSLRSTRPGTPAMSIPSSPSTPTGSEVTSRCLHTRVTRQGTNGSIYQERCADCGKLLKKESKHSDSESVQSSGSKAKSAPSVRTRMTKETLDEFQEFLEFRKWRQSKQPPSGGNESD